MFNYSLSFAFTLTHGGRTGEVPITYLVLILAFTPNYLHNNMYYDYDMHSKGLQP